MSICENPEDPRVRAIRLARERKLDRARCEKSKANRQALITRGDAVTVSPREFCELSGLSRTTVYRRIYDGTLKHKKLNGRVLISYSEIERLLTAAE
jgi:excisionase family DNA binding protein